MYPKIFKFIPKKEFDGSFDRLEQHFLNNNISYTSSPYALTVIVNNEDEENYLANVMRHAHEHCPYGRSGHCTTATCPVIPAFITDPRSNHCHFLIIHETKDE